MVKNFVKEDSSTSETQTTGEVFVIDEKSPLTKRTNVSSTPDSTVEKKTPEVSDRSTWARGGKPTGKATEFGGTMGCFALMLFSHFIVPYFYLSLNHNNCDMIIPESLTVEGFTQFFIKLFTLFTEHCVPTVYAVQIYLAALFLQVFFAYVLPGAIMVGIPVPTEGNRRLAYLCNAFASWYCTIAVSLVLHFTGIFKVTEVVDNLGPLTTVAMIMGDFFSICVYLSGFLFGLAANDRTGSLPYDFFMGCILNPRLGILDIKMFAEVRVSWIILSYINISAAVKQYETYGYVSYSMMVVLFGIISYSNSIMKGEHLVVPTWDIHHEKYGWMLCFWNFAGVPFVYCAQSIYILRANPEPYHGAYYLALFIIYLFTYYVFDTANAQKNSFRLVLNGTYIERPYCFPQFSYGNLKNPKYITTKHGNPILVDGWYAYARKFHYTVDIIQSFCWGAACGFKHFIPFFYVIFFSIVLFDRVTRDERKMAKKYGDDYDRYCKIVPYRFIPGIY